MFTLAAELRHTMSLLEAAMAELIAALHEFAGADPVAVCYQLPDVSLGKEHEPVERIPVQATSTGRDALTAACTALTRWHLQPDCSAKASFRLPGYMVLPAASREHITPLVEEINRLKQMFRAQIQQLDDKDKKFTLVHDTFPGLITLQVYRRLTLLPHSASRLGFTWANKQIIQKVDRDKLITRLMQSRHTPPPLVEAETWLQCVDREIYDIKRLPPDVELRLRRPVKTHPMVNVRWTEPLSPRQQQYKAHLPLLLCQDEMPAVTHLRDYPPAKPRKARAAKIQGEPIIPRLHIYPYVP